MKKAFFWVRIVAVATAALALVLPTLPQNPQTQTAPLYSVNAKYTNGTAPGYWPTQLSIANGSGGTIAAATGLNINLGAGTANCGSGNVVTYNGGTLALTASATNRIYLNTGSACAPAVKTTAFVSADIPIAVVVTSGSAITSITDDRTMFILSSGASVAWGLITGSLSAQTDLQNALNLKANSASPSFTGTVDASGASAFRFSSSGFTNLHCIEALVSGGIMTLGDAGAACGTGSGSGVQYPNPPAFAFMGDSLGVVSTINSTGSLNSSTASAAACDGTNCNLTDATGVGAGFYRVGQWLFPGTDNLSGFSPACLAYSRAQITSIVGNQVFWSETSQTSQVPGHGSSQGGCSGVVSGTGGLVQDASYFFPYQAAALPYFTKGGTATPVIINRHWPGQDVVNLDTNWTTYAAGIPSGSWVFVQENSACSGSGSATNPATWIAALSSILTKIHAAGQKAILMTTPNGPTFNCGLGVTGDATVVAVNNWIIGSLCGVPSNPSSSPVCSDGVIDLATKGANDRNNTSGLVEPYIQTNQSGALVSHYTNAGNILTALAINQALVNGTGSDTSSGLAGIHAANSFTQTQIFSAGWNTNNTAWQSQLVSGNFQDFINGLMVWRAPYNYGQLLQRASWCWAENDSGTIGDYADSPGGGCFSEAFQGSANGIYSHKIAVGSGVFPSITTPPTPGDPTGGLVFQDWIAHGRSSDPTCSNLLATDGMIWYNSTSNTIKSCQNGVVVSWPGAAPVTSVFGRTGAVAANSGDYSVGQVTGAAPLASPTFTGTPAAPTATGGTNTTQLATTAFVQAAIAAAGTGAGIVTYSGPSLTFSGTQFFPIGGGASASSTETNVDIDAPAAVTIQNMTVQMSAAPGVGNSVVYTWRKNASDTVLTCTISGASATSCSDTTHNFSTASLDLLDIKAVTTGTIVGTPTVVMAAQVGVAATATTAFSAISGGTNTGAAMVVGSGASIDVGGTGTINANKVNGATIASSLTSLATDPSGHIVAAAPVNTVIDTSTPVTVSTSLTAEYHFNENTTTATAVTYNLPTAVAGKQFCFSNAFNGSAANTGILTVATSASGQFIIFTDGTLSATGGNITSGGAASDAACVVGVDSTHWQLYVQRGTWTKH